MKPLVEAQREVLAAMVPLGSETVPLSEALGRVLAEDVAAPHAVPPFANSGVDGFAVRSSDLVAGPVTLLVVDDVPAGRVASRAVAEGTAIRVMTGAPIPEGADSVVMVEDTTVDGDRVRIERAVPVGAHVRPRGGDVAEGTTVFSTGDRLSAAHLGVLASLGVTEPRVAVRPTVTVLSTGDEVVDPATTTLTPGAIRDANGPMLVGLLEQLGTDVIGPVLVSDDPVALRAMIVEAAASSDAIVTTGGVSVGDHDLVKVVLGELGSVDLWRVAMQPAKPFAFGVIDGVPLFGLPGNPVSAFVAYEQFVRPALLRRMGATRLFRPQSQVECGEALTTDPSKTVFLRMRLVEGDDGPKVVGAGTQVSNVLSAMAAADVFGVIPVGVGDVAEGAMITVEWFANPETRTMEEALS
ncbi:MAG TPA: gephyrin-like molybdotransferase Glp [Acidimicrobiia bacterium]|nr:gephyrin-like molybdotransferase Glp [Acidimicrobiia bacterium]